MTDIALDLDSLRRQLGGQAYGRTDEGYSNAVAGYNSVAPVRPEIAVVAESESDIAIAVRFAAEHGLRVSVMCTGHGSYAPIADGLLVRTNQLVSVEVDAASAIARLGAGVIWRDAMPVFQSHGLVAITGSSASVGAIGLALGGGMGPLSRSYGYTADWVTGFRVVDASGAIIVADADENSELFWALRGGKGGLGIVTEMSLRLIELPTVYGGGLFFTGADIAPVYQAWVEWADGRPESVNTSLNLLRLPDVPDVPAPLRGRVALHLRFVYTEPGLDDATLQARGEAELAPFRALGSPVLDSISLLPSADISTVHADPEGPLPIWESGMLLEPIDSTFVERLLEQVGEGVDAPFIAVEVRCMGGRIRSTHTETAIGGRDGAYSLLLVGTPIVEWFAEVIPAAAARLNASIGPWISTSNTYNWAGYPSTAETFAACWPVETHDRLTALRARVDPNRLFAFGPAGIAL